MFSITLHGQSTSHLMIIVLRLHYILCDFCLPLSFETLTVSQIVWDTFLQNTSFLHISCPILLLLFLVYYLSLFLTLSLCLSVYLSAIFSLSLSLSLSWVWIVTKTGRVVKLGSLKYFNPCTSSSLDWTVCIQLIDWNCLWP